MPIMLFGKSESTDGAAERTEDVPTDSGVLIVSTTGGIAREITLSADAVLRGDTSPMEAKTAPASNSGVVVENLHDTISCRLIERGTTRVREDIAEEVSHAAEQLFGTQAEFEAQIRATIENQRLKEPKTFKQMLVRAGTFLFKDRIKSYAARQDNEGVSAEEARRVIVEIIEHAMRTRGGWLSDMLTRNRLWVVPGDTKDHHAT